VSIQCSNCAFENVTDSKFCENCGQPFERACPNCNNPISSAAKFCRNCGFNLASVPNTPQARLATLERAAPQPLQQKILASRDQMQGERKLVTVLFSDIVGSTALAEKLDPEDWGEIVSGAHRCVTQAIYKYEGTIAQLLGDGVLAFFGAPVTHEDDPVRAVSAALAILASVGEYAVELKTKRRVENFQMRVGLNTGLVVVGNIGSDLHVEYLAVGDTVNLAARMQSAADPNTILVSQNTARWAKHMFDLESRGEIEVKGKAEPVPAFRVLNRKAIPESARGIEGLDSPIVGRDRELKLLQTRVDELLQGRGQIVSVMADAGLGKSRLVAEIRKWVAAERAMQWSEGRALSYQTTTTYAIFVDLFNRLFGLLPEESDAEKYASVQAGVERVTGHRAAEFAPFIGNERTHLERHESNSNEVSPFIGTLLGLKLEGDALERVRYLEPPQLREKIFGAVLHFFEHLAEKQPVVLIFEDLHWVDSVSLALIEQLMLLAEKSPVLILALFRPQTQEPSWHFHETSQRDHAQLYTSIALEPLDEKASRQLVANLLEIEDLPEKVRALILKKAEGNPFFVEEVIRSLLDAKLVVRTEGHWRATREIENIQLPDTLAGVIGARLDRLDEESKKVAQTAAVIGREFEFDILSDVYETKPGLENSIGTLQRRELVREKSRAPNLLYLFKHALTQETAYGSLLLSKRRGLHKKVAECLEAHEAERVNEIAWHYLEAQDSISALPYLIQAGERAVVAFSIPEATQYFTQALDILKDVNDPALARRAYEGLGSVLMMTMNVPRAFEHFSGMLAYGEAHRDLPMQVSAHNKLGMVMGMYMGQMEPAEQHLRDAEKLGKENQDGAGLFELYTIRCQVCTMQADFSNATHYLGQSVSVGRDMKLDEPHAFGLTHTANTYTYMCRFDDAFEKGKEALALAEKIGNQRFMAEVFAFVFPFYYMHLGDLERARAECERGTTIAHRIGDGLDEGIGIYLQGQIAAWKGEYERVLELYRQSYAISLTSSFRFDALPLAALGATYRDLGEKFFDQTLEFSQQAIQSTANPMIAASAAFAWADLGFNFLALGKTDEAHEQFQKGLNYPSFTGLLAKPQNLIGAAFVALARGQTQDAIRTIHEAREFAETHAMKFAMPFVEWAEAQALGARGDPSTGSGQALELALQHLARSESLATEMQMRPSVLRARASAASLLSKLGRTSDAEKKRSEARAMIEEIAGLFKDETLKQAFIDNATKTM